MKWKPSSFVSVASAICIEKFRNVEVAAVSTVHDTNWIVNRSFVGTRATRAEQIVLGGALQSVS